MKFREWFRFRKQANLQEERSEKADHLDRETLGMMGEMGLREVKWIVRENWQLEWCKWHRKAYPVYSNK